MTQKRMHRILSVAILAFLTITPVWADSTAELLEKAVYTEQTVGDLDAAMEIYSQITASHEANRAHVAQAYYRLGVCRQKKGQDAEARTAFQTVIADFSDQERLVTQARRSLAAVQSQPAWEPAPWEDGELLTYRMRLPTGKVMGALYLMAESAVYEGRDVWRLELRRLLIADSNAYGVSRMLVDRESRRPIVSTLRHGVLGNADASFGPDGVTISGKDVVNIPGRQAIFDHDQSIHLMRMLPLETGYEAKLNLLPLWTGKVIETGLKVEGIERCQVPAGDFECFGVALELEQQTFWYATGAERYPVKVQTGGLVVELVGIDRFQAQEPATFEFEGFGLGGTLPPGWLSYDVRLETNKGFVRLLDPEAQSLSSMELHRCPQRGCPDLGQNAERELAGAKRRFDGFQLREDTWKQDTVGDRTIIRFAGEYRRQDEDWVQYRAYSFVNDVRVELIFRVPAERFEALRATFDSLIDSIGER